MLKFGKPARLISKPDRKPIPPASSVNLQRNTFDFYVKSLPLRGAF
jgi:hypothetical protein